MKIKLKEIRKAKDLTLEELEALCGLSRATLNRIENEVVSPRMIQMEWIAIALGVSFNELFESKVQYTRHISQKWEIAYLYFFSFKFRHII